MDKNTITGLLLMAVVMFGFMWLNQPSEEELAEQRKQQQAQQEQQAQAKQSIEATDTLSASEIRNLATVVASYGKQMPDGSKTVNDENVALTWADGQVSGSIALADTTVSLDAVINRSLAPLTYNQAMTAVRRLANNTARYKNFAASMTGSDTTVVLENELLSLEVSSKGGIISSAVLKTYNNCHNEPVRLFTADTDCYSFVLNATDTRYDTKDFYFVPTQLNDSTLLMTLDLGEAKFGLRYTLPHDSYLVKMEVVQEHMNKVIPVNIADMGFNWQQKMVRNEKGRMFEERNSAIYLNHIAESYAFRRYIHELTLFPEIYGNEIVPRHQEGIPGIVRGDLVNFPVLHIGLGDRPPDSRETAQSHRCGDPDIIRTSRNNLHYDIAGQ